MTIWHSVLLEEPMPRLMVRCTEIYGDHIVMGFRSDPSDLTERAKHGYYANSSWHDPRWDDLPPHRQESWREAVRNGRVPWSSRIG